MTVKRYRAKVVPKVLKCKTFHGYPTNTAQKYEVCEKDVAAFMPQLKSGKVPFCYNHNEKDVVGRVVNASRNPVDNALEIEYELDTSTEKGKDMDQWISKGRMASVSLSHNWGSNTVNEVSGCWIPARDGSDTYADVTDPQEVKLLRQLHFNSKSGRYERQPDPQNPIRVAASAEEEEQNSSEVLIFPLDMSVNASAAGLAGAAAALQQTQQAPPAASPPPPAAAAATGVVPMDQDDGGQQEEEEKKQQAPAAAAGGASSTPPAPGKAIEFVKNKFTYGNGPWKKDDQVAVLNAMYEEELAKDKALKEAADARAELASLKARQEARDKEIEAEVKRKQDALNESLKTKVADALEGLDPDLPMKARIEASLASATQKELEAFDIDIQSVLKVQASRPMQFRLEAERKYNEWHAQKNQPQQQQQQAPLMPPFSAPPAAAANKIQASKPPTGGAVGENASREFGMGDIGAPRTKPRALYTDPVRASAMRRTAAFRGMGAVGEYASVDATIQEAEWKSGAGANFHHDKIIENMRPDTRERYFAIWDHSMCDNATGGKMKVEAGHYQRPDVVANFCRYLRGQPHLMRVNEFDDDFASNLGD